MAPVFDTFLLRAEQVLASSISVDESYPGNKHLSIDVGVYNLPFGYILLCMACAPRSGVDAAMHAEQLSLPDGSLSTIKRTAFCDKILQISDIIPDWWYWTGILPGF
jgi:hypothetical protein